ncbi:MAG: hypothetical protein WD294_13015 [Phycisphaeraceae bacterium]
MRILVPYFLLLVVLFFAAWSVARRSRRARHRILLIGWCSVGVLVIGTVGFAWLRSERPIATLMLGFFAAFMLAYGVRAVQRRTAHVRETDGRRGRRRAVRTGAVR